MKRTLRSLWSHAGVGGAARGSFWGGGLSLGWVKEVGGLGWGEIGETGCQ